MGVLSGELSSIEILSVRFCPCGGFVAAAYGAATAGNTRGGCTGTVKKCMNESEQHRIQRERSMRIHSSRVELQDIDLYVYVMVCRKNAEMYGFIL